jgi:hypothetical protein
MDDILITAKSSEEFTMLSNKIKELPEKVLGQINKVTSEHWVSCYLKPIIGDNKDIFIPKYTTQITDFGDYIGIYCGDFFLKAPKADFHYTYILVD